MHHRHHPRIAARHGAFEHVRPKHQRIGRLGEVQAGAPKAASMLVGVERLRVFEVDRLRRPASSQALAEDIEEHAQRQLGVLAALHDFGGPDLVLEHQQAIAPGSEAEQRVLLVKRERVDDVAQRRPQRGRRHRQVAPQPEVVRPELVAEPEPEVSVAGPVRGFLEEAAEAGELDGQGRGAGHGRGHPGVAEDAVDITAPALDLLDDAGCGGCENDGSSSDGR